MKTYKLRKSNIKSNIKFRTCGQNLNDPKKKYKKLKQSQYPLKNRTKKKILIGSGYLSTLGISGVLISSFYCYLKKSKIDDNIIKDEEHNFLDELNKFSGIFNILKNIINGFNINLVQTKMNKIQQLKEESSSLDEQIKTLQLEVNKFTGILEKSIFTCKGFLKILTLSPLMTNISHRLGFKTQDAQKLIQLKKEAEAIQNRINKLNSSNLQQIKKQVSSFYHQIKANLPSFYTMVTTGVSLLPMNYLIRYDEDGDILFLECEYQGKDEEDKEINNYFNYIPTFSKWKQKLVSPKGSDTQWAPYDPNNQIKDNVDPKEFEKKLYDVTTFIKDPSSLNLPLDKNYNIYRVGVHRKDNPRDITFILKDEDCQGKGTSRTPKECEGSEELKKKICKVLHKINIKLGFNLSQIKKELEVKLIFLNSKFDTLEESIEKYLNDGNVSEFPDELEKFISNIDLKEAKGLRNSIIEMINGIQNLVYNSREDLEKVLTHISQLTDAIIYYLEILEKTKKEFEDFKAHIKQELESYKKDREELEREFDMKKYKYNFLKSELSTILKFLKEDYVNKKIEHYAKDDKYEDALKDKLDLFKQGFKTRTVKFIRLIEDIFLNQGKFNLDKFDKKSLNNEQLNEKIDYIKTQIDDSEMIKKEYQSFIQSIESELTKAIKGFISQPQEKKKGNKTAAPSASPAGKGKGKSGTGP